MPTPGDLVLPLAVASAAGLIGSVAVMRRMTLASDALAHIALPGIGLALTLHHSPLLGALTALVVGSLLVWGLEHRTRLPTDAVVGVVFSAALAIGSLLTAREELIEALFGASPSLTIVDTILGVAASAAVALFVWSHQSRLVIALISSDLARTAGIRVARLDLWYLMAFAVTVALGLRFLGVLLMGSLIIIPAATAKHLARSLSAMRALAVSLAALSTLVGTLLAARLSLASGPVIILVAATLFVVSLLVRDRANA